MSGESDLVDRLAQSIADGSPIDWTAIDKLPADERLRQLFALLRIVDEVAEVHRSLGDDSRAIDPADISTFGPFESGRLEAGIGQWGHLLLRRKIGEGAFGEVYHAHDMWLDHPVALKLFKRTITNRDAANRLLHEARTLARVRHPNVVTVHGADSHNGRVGFWMDLVEGATLESIVRSGCLSAGEAAYIGQEVCRALAAVHHAGIVHRDVKAQNVMRVADGGRIILMDFGAGELIKDKPADSPKQGTPLYLAPEIFEGRDASIKSDIYAVGVLLFFLVTGGFPVRAESIPLLLDAHRRGDRRRLRDGRPDLPGAFVSVVERALDPDPDLRFATAGEMEAALAVGSTTHVAPLGVERTKGAPSERTPLQKIAHLALATTVIIAVIAILGLIACRAFEVALGVEPEFAAGVADYLSIGAAALLPFGIYWLGCAAIMGILAGLRPLFRRPLAALRRASMAMSGPVDSDTMATLVAVFGLGCWLALNWWCLDLIRALEALRVGAASASDVAVLSSGWRPLQRTLADYSAYLSFVLGFALWRWFPAFEKDAVDRSRVRALKWATMAIAVMTVVTATLPRRVVWENFEVVRFENEESFVIGTSRDELLLYNPNRHTKHRVRLDSFGLQRTGARARIFDPR